jgi:CxxC-x17-CxxC domain-containing protein
LEKQLGEIGKTCYNGAMSFDRNDSRGGGFRGGRGGFGGGRGGFGGGRSSFGRGGGFGGGDRPMFDATCSDCGKPCQVPFRPTNGKPVYCSECFEKNGNGRSDSPRPERSEFRAPSFDQKAQFDALNAKLEKIISLLEPKKIEAVMPDLVVEEVKEVKAPKAKKVASKKKK